MAERDPARGSVRDAEVRAGRGERECRPEASDERRREDPVVSNGRGPGARTPRQPFLYWRSAVAALVGATRGP